MPALGRQSKSKDLKPKSVDLKVRASIFEKRTARSLPCAFHLQIYVSIFHVVLLLKVRLPPIVLSLLIAVATLFLLKFRPVYSQNMAPIENKRFKFPYLNNCSQVVLKGVIYQ